MQIRISSSSQLDLEKAQQVVMYYHIQLEDQLRMLKLNLSHVPDSKGKIIFRLKLDAIHLSGQIITIEEFQSDLQTATNRILNRLIRMTRRSMSQDRIYNIL